jgi:putative transcriptional regulator
MMRAYGLASRAVLIGSTGGHESRRAGIEDRLGSLSDLLSEEMRWAQHPDNCTVLVDPAHRREVDLALKGAGEGVGTGGLLFVYYIGPVLLGQGYALSLVLPNTDVHDLPGTAVQGQMLRWRVSENRARWKVLVLDCHDLAADAGTNGAEAIAEAAATNRTSVVVHASPEAGAEHGRLTDELVDLMTNGIRRGPNVLDVQLLHSVAAERLAAADLPAPVLRTGGSAETIPLIRNPALYRADLAGQVLYATDAATDPELAGTVVLILRYDKDTGGLGVVINRPGTASAPALAPNWAGVLGKPAVVFNGGPAQHEGYISLALLRRDTAAPLRFRPVTDRVGTLALSVPADGAVERFRLFRGYLGWPPGSLEADLAREVLVPTHRPAHLAFSDEPARLWRHVQAAS